MDADGRGLLGSNLRDVVGCFQRSGAAITYTAPATAPDSANSTGDGHVGCGHTKTTVAAITITAESGLSDGERQSEEGGADDGRVTDFHRDGIGKLEYFRDVGSGHDSWRQFFGGDDQLGGSVYAAIKRRIAHSRRAFSGGPIRGGGTASVAITDLAGVFTYHNDLSRDGVNNKEYALNTSNVKTATFGKRFACSIDAAAYAQPSVGGKRGDRRRNAQRGHRRHAT